MITTLEKIRAHNPCRHGWEKLLRHLGKTQADDEPLPIVTILDSNGLEDALWCLRAVEGRHREIRIYAVWCARQVQPLMRDPRSIAALDVAERHARGKASHVEFRAAAARAKAAYAAAWKTVEAAQQAADAAAHRALTEMARSAWAAWSASSAKAAFNIAYGAWQADATKAAQAAELRRVCREIEAGRDPYQEDGR